MLVAREVLRLALSCGSDRSSISNSCGIDTKTVDKYLRRVSDAGLSYADIEALCDSELIKILKSKKGRKREKLFLEPDFQYIHAELKRKGVTRQLLWEEYILQNPGGYRRTQFCHLYQEWKKRLNPSMRQNHKAGEKMFVDYSGQTVGITDPKIGKTKQAEIFVAVLGASNYTFANASLSQNMSDWIDSHVKAFAYFKGVTAIIVPDNLKSGVNKACRYDPELNREYREMAVHYGTAVIPTRVRAPKDKAKAENGVLVVQRWILAVLRNRTFFSLNELNQAILELLIRLNSRPFKKLSGSRQSLFETVDKPALLPLPQTSYSYAEWKTTKVGMDYHVDLKEHFYSVPYQHIDQRVEMRFTRNTVEIFFNNKRIASHRRDDTPRESTTQKAHMPISHQQYLEWTPTKILVRSQEIGESVFNVVKRIFDDRPHSAQAIKATVGIIRLAKRFSEQRLQAACQKALEIDGCTYQSIQSILKTGLDSQDIQPAKIAEPIYHGNIRGGDYFLTNENNKSGDFIC